MRVSNIDTLSAYIDRLITERIKWYFFEKANDEEKSNHQKVVIAEIRKKISELIYELIYSDYDYIGDKRTFELMDNIEKLTIFDIEIGESDRERLKLSKEIVDQNKKECYELEDYDLTRKIANDFSVQEQRLRTANEMRSKTKNEIDKNTEEIFE